MLVIGERLKGEHAKKERVEWEQLAKEAEAERLCVEQEEKAAEDSDTSPAATQDGKDKVKENLRISTNFKQHPGNLYLTDVKKTNIPAPQSALATTHVISDINAITYPEGASSPNPAQSERQGRYVNAFRPSRLF